MIYWRSIWDFKSSVAAKVTRILMKIEAQNFNYFEKFIWKKLISDSIDNAHLECFNYSTSFIKLKTVSTTKHGHNPQKLLNQSNLVEGKFLRGHKRLTLKYQRLLRIASTPVEKLRLK